MAYAVGGGGISAGFEVDMTALRAAMSQLDRYMGDLTKVNREAAQEVSDERKARVPYRTGHFAKAAYVRASTRSAYVGLRNTGRGSNDYIGVQEFGGSIPRHQGRAKEQSFTLVKPHSADGYYLVPALDAKREAITEKYRDHVAALAAKYMP